MVTKYDFPARSGHTVVTFQKELLLFGGEHYTGSLIQSMNFVTGSITDIPSYFNNTIVENHSTIHHELSRSNAAIAIEGKTMYLFGGLQSNSSEAMNDMWMFDLYTREWKQVVHQTNESWPTTRSNSNFMARSDNKLFLFQGCGSEAIEVWIFSSMQS